MLYYFTFSQSHSWGKRSIGSTPTRRRIPRGHYVPPISSKILSHRQDQCSTWEDIELSATTWWEVREAWEHFQDYILECPHHGIENWLLMQTFYHGLSNSTHKTMDAATEEHSYHLLSLKPLLLWKRWHPIKVGVKKELRPTREVEECTSSRR